MPRRSSGGNDDYGEIGDCVQQTQSSNIRSTRSGVENAVGGGAENRLQQSKETLQMLHLNAKQSRLTPLAEEEDASGGECWRE
ncbi:CHCH domain [Musa troglodytarum]|uniref:CHCH domain n=1 Tax=Musa troglodytarum TaxID=320322 RepID=A0A9E7KIR2_9LILI|nr:CHCH domain [Musa troglodytarum]